MIDDAARKPKMKGPLISAVALVFLASAPFAEAFQIVQSTGVPAASSLRVADPNEIREGMGDLGPRATVTPSPFSNRLRFGTSPTISGWSDEPARFLESPAIRTVPSQQR
jgi:hypothetical protein